MSTAEPELFTDYYDYNETDHDLVYLCENHETNLFGAKFTPVWYSISFILSLVGNALVLWVLVRYEKLSCVTDIFILNLVASDLLFAFSLPFWAVDHTSGWIFGKAMCKIMSAIFFIAYYSGIMLLTLMTVDRYFTVVHPVFSFRIRKISHAVTASLVVWGVSISVTIPEMIFSDIEVNWEESFSCVSRYPPESAHIWSLLGYYQQNLLFFLFPFAVIVFCYCRILNTVIRCKARKKHKTVKVILCIVVVFFLCWAPYNVVIFLFSLVELQVPEFLTCEMNNHLTYAFYISRSIAYCHCCLNPFFYAFAGTRFRKHLTKIASKHFPYKGIYKQPKYRHRSHHLSSSNEYSNASTFCTSYL
ncbi:chemokine XC receptor 1-like [Carcharodon carcharias]|uniref:chemokine XC receptor 1-like n=1 Tax=Carcharodon carcharias TaxID=13397 RepID=UPI001B7F2BC7|nr:chemokine XC receptor 1-like [Carcharodon carcharias]